MRTKFILASFLLSCQVYPQVSLSLYGGINPPSNIMASNGSNFLDEYWKSGISVGLGGELLISPSFALSSSVEYAYYGFHSYAFRGASIPEVRFKSSKGDASRVWRSFAEIKLSPTGIQTVHYYFSTGAGYIVEQIGAIQATFEDMNGSDFTNTIQFQSKSFIVHTLGLGVRWHAFSDVALDLKGQYFSNYGDRLHSTLKVGILYSLVI